MSKNYKELLDEAKKLFEMAEKQRLVELKVIIEGVKSTIAEYALTAEDCGFKALPKRKATSNAKKGEAKYANPANPAETWSGKGRKPAWIHAHLEKGGKLEALLISE